MIINADAHLLQLFRQSELLTYQSVKGKLEYMVVLQIPKSREHEIKNLYQFKDTISLPAEADWSRCT